MPTTPSSQTSAAAAATAAARTEVDLTGGSSEDFLTGIAEATQRLRPADTDYNTTKRCNWTWAFVKDGRCLACLMAASDPTTVTKIGPISASNIASHLRSHGLTATSPVTIARVEHLMKAKQPTISFDNGMQLRATLDYMLAYGEPPSRCRDPVFRAAHPLIKQSYEAHRSELVVHAVRRRNEALDKFARKQVTIAVDGGTVWGHYLCVVLLCAGQALTIGLPRCTGSMTAQWIREKVIGIIDHRCKPRKIKPMCIVGDNAANMQAAIRATELPMISTKCFIHSAQLVVNDFFANGTVKHGRETKPLSEVWAQILGIFTENGLPSIPATRWNCKLLNMKKVRDDNSIQVQDIELMNTINRLIDALDPYHTVTMLLQSNAATLLEAATCAWKLLLCTELDSRTGGPHGSWSQLRSIGCRPEGPGLPPSRIDKLLSPGVIVVCYFHPGVSRHQFRDLRDFVGAKLLKVAANFTTRPSDLSQLFTQVHTSKPEPDSSPCTIAQYTKFWNDQDYDLLVQVILAIANINPTESDCERVFSKLKWTFTRLRTRAGDDLVEKSVCGQSAVHMLNNLEVDQGLAVANIAAATPTPEDETEILGEKERKKREFIELRSLRVDQAEALLKLYRDEVWKPAQERLNTRDAQPNDEICGKCHRAEAATWPGREPLLDWNQCSKCKVWFHNTCVGLDPTEDTPVLDAWKCSSCVRIRRN